MSEGVIIALISFASAVVGAAISGFATVVAAGIKGKGDNQSAGTSSVSCAVVGLFASIGAAGGLVLGAFFGLSLVRADSHNLVSNNPVISNPAAEGNSTPLSVQLPNNLSCQQHSSGYCGLTMTVTWTNIDANSEYYIYAIGHGLHYQPEMWWVAGNGFPVSTPNGSQVITDGAYGNSGDSLGVFVCLTKTKYSFDGKKEILFYDKPSCEMYSQEVYFQPK
ncbi:MAG: hypothetical protein HND47_17745 [Chloroflexi bacterium]|nr:hypothetical protein [Chloroflexota bacterium]